jgi:hypothetical protein
MYPSCDDPSKLLAYDSFVHFQSQRVDFEIWVLEGERCHFPQMLHDIVQPLKLCQRFLFVHAMRYLGCLSNCTRNIGSDISCLR